MENILSAWEDLAKRFFDTDDSVTYYHSISDKYEDGKRVSHQEKEIKNGEVIKDESFDSTKGLEISQPKQNDCKCGEVKCNDENRSRSIDESFSKNVVEYEAAIKEKEARIYELESRLKKKEALINNLTEEVAKMKDIVKSIQSLAKNVKFTK